MPIYIYGCNLGHQTERLFRIGKAPGQITCQTCRRKMKRLVAAAHTNLPYLQPVLSDAMGVHPDQVAEHRQKFPDVPILDDGRVVVSNHSEFRRITKRLGFIDRSR